MPTPLIICDDSSFARKQMARALPEHWDVDVTFAANGQEALEAIRKGKGEILFLDLNMPVMDGYQTLAAIRREDLPVMTIVVSGDVQPEAHKRVTALGALDFIRKPVDPEQVSEILRRYGIDIESRATRQHIEVETDLLDAAQEVANIAMGRAGDLLARLLGAFVVLPVPRVNHLDVGELQMLLEQVDQDKGTVGVCQGFIGAGIAGEAMLVFHESSFTDIARLMKYDGEIDEAVQLELLMDISGILIGACLKGIADQLDLCFSQGHPIVLGTHVKTADLIERNAPRWGRTLAIEMGYTIEGHDISCDLLLLFTGDSIDALNDRLSCLGGNA
ncbi:MAG TPA: response regulator [Thiotrichales bacterium]|nr:response regulator [Thiotrichales bacterium]